MKRRNFLKLIGFSSAIAALSSRIETYAKENNINWTPGEPILIHPGVARMRTNKVIPAGAYLTVDDKGFVVEADISKDRIVGTAIDSTHYLLHWET